MNATSSAVLLLERDPAARAGLAHALSCEGLETICAETSAEAEHALTARRVCLILLNPRLAPEDGWAVFRRLRRCGLPIVVLVPDGDPTLQRLALTLGADDCVLQPSSPEQVATRARFVLQRAREQPTAGEAYGEVTLEPSLVGARVAGRLVTLTSSEYGLLAALVEARGRVVPRERLVVRARAGAAALPLSRSIDSHVRSLRRKLGDDEAAPRLLLAVRGVGYRLAGASDAPAQGLAEAAFQALREPALVLDSQLRVRLMNRAAAALVTEPRTPLDCLTCSAVLHCSVARTGCGTCPAAAAMAASSPRQSALVIQPRDRPLTVSGIATQLPGQAGHLLLQLDVRSDG